MSQLATGGRLNSGVTRSYLCLRLIRDRRLLITGSQLVVACSAPRWLACVYGNRSRGRWIRDRIKPHWAVAVSLAAAATMALRHCRHPGAPLSVAALTHAFVFPLISC